MVRIALAPCSPFSVTPALMRQTAELAERLDVRLHTHLAEDPDEDTLRRGDLRQAAPSSTSRRSAGCTDRSWVAHCIYPNAEEIARLGPLGHRRGPLPELEHDDRRGRHRPGGRPAGRRGARRARLRRLGVDRLAPRCGWRPATPCCWAGCGVARRRPAPGTPWRSATRGGGRLPRALRASSGCSSRRRRRRPRVLAAGGHRLRRGAVTDPVEAWLRCGPVAARHTVVAGRAVVRDGAAGRHRASRTSSAVTAVASERLQAD